MSCFFFLITVRMDYCSLTYIWAKEYLILVSHMSHVRSGSIISVQFKWPRDEVGDSSPSLSGFAPAAVSAHDLAVDPPFELCEFGFLLAWPSLAGLFALTMIFLVGVPSPDRSSQHIESKESEELLHNLPSDWPMVCACVCGESGARLSNVFGVQLGTELPSDRRESLLGLKTQT
jgi:hypothetical protein